MINWVTNGPVTSSATKQGVYLEIVDHMRITHLPFTAYANGRPVSSFNNLDKAKEFLEERYD